MVGVEDPEHVERAREPFVRLVLELGHPEHHREEVLGIREVVVRIVVGEPEAVPVGEGGEGGDLGDQAHRGHVALLVVLDVLGAGVEGRERADGREQHPHRMGVVAEALHEALDVLVHVGVDRDLVLPLVVLLLGGELAVDEEVRDLEVGGVLGEVLDRVAAVLKDPGLAVDVRDLASAGRRVRERRVVGHEAEVVLIDLDLAEVHRLHRAVCDLDLVGLARAVVGDAERVLGRGYPTAVPARLGLLVGHLALLDPVSPRCASTRIVTDRRGWLG